MNKVTPLHLLTREDKIKLTSSLRNSFHRNNQLLLPDEEIYPTNSYSSKDIEKVGKKICVWLGAKPNNLSFISDNTKDIGYSFNNDEFTINIPERLFSNPLVTAAIIARGCLSFYLEKKGYKNDNELLEIGLIEMGLGLLIVNAMDSGHDFRSSFLRTFPVKHNHVVSNDVLCYFSCQEFRRLFTGYVSRNDLDHRVVVEHIVPWMQKAIHLHLDFSGKLLEPDYITSARRKRSDTRMKVMGLGCLIITILIPGVIFWNNRPRGLPAPIQNQKDNIEVLALSYQACEDSLKYKQKTYDLTDIFMIRQIDAHLSRCQSMRNRHDHLVKIYNQEVARYN